MTLHDASWLCWKTSTQLHFVKRLPAEASAGHVEGIIAAPAYGSAHLTDTPQVLGAETADLLEEVSSQEGSKAVGILSRWVASFEG